MLEFVNELPADVRGGRNRLARTEIETVFDALAANPNQWAILEKGAPQSRITTWRARADRMGNGMFEFVSGGDSDAQTIYGRYVGNNSSDI